MELAIGIIALIGGMIGLFFLCKWADEWEEMRKRWEGGE